MLFDPSTTPQLKPWLIRTLEPICDAEPGALADYIDALLRHNVPESEMRRELETQLSEFLEKETSSFVDTLFTVLRTKSYLPYNTATADENAASTSGIHIPLDAAIPGPAGGSRKRGLDSDDSDGRAPAKGPRLSSDGHTPRFPSGTGGYEQWGRGGRHMNGHGEQGGSGRSSQYRPPDLKRGICRDYYNSGYCSRGAYCKYSHGEDAVLPNQLFSLPGAMSFMLANGGMPPFGGAYDPHESRMDMRPSQHQKAPIIPRAMQEGGQGLQHASGELPVIQDLTPMQEDMSHPRNGTASTSQIASTSALPAEFDMQVDSAPAPPPPRPRGGRAGRGQRGNGRGTFRGEVHALRPDQRSDKTLVVEKIPDDKLSLEVVNTWFKKFGTVTNVAVDAPSAKALVSFSSHAEAHAAWKSEEAVFGNRFVKVFWHRPMAGHGQVGAKALAASAPLVANLSKPEATVSTPSSPAPKPAPKKQPPSAAVAALAEKQRLLDSQIAEQKRLMELLSSASADEKKDIMARLRKLGEEMKAQSSTPAASSSNIDTPGDGQDKAKAQLDRELDAHAAVSEGQETTEELKATLEKLKAEAASLGISDGDSSYPPQPTYRGYRGRGRGSYRGYTPRGAFRGGPPRGSMKLDNRPKKLLIKGTDSSNMQSIRDWYEGGAGQPESVDTTPDGDVLVSFRTRADAEQAMAKGSSIPLVGSVDISWSSANPSSQQRPMPAPKDQNVQEDADEQPSAGKMDAEHEEEISGGWGDADIGM